MGTYGLIFCITQSQCLKLLIQIQFCLFKILIVCRTFYVKLLGFERLFKKKIKKIQTLYNVLSIFVKVTSPS